MILKVEECWSWNSKNKENYNSCWVIDGQHRLFSYLKVDSDEIDDTIHVSGISKILILKLKGGFIDINDNGATVNKDLIWDLAGAWFWCRKRNYFKCCEKNLFRTNKIIIFFWIILK